MTLRVVFAGTPAFAVPSLDALLAAGHEVCAVYTQPDRRAGRGRALTPCPVKRRAEAAGLTVHQPDTLRHEAPVLQALAPEVMVVVAYGLLLPPAVLAVPARGCLNVHASLLPRWRGAAPIQRAIEAGDERTGITIMQMDAGLDTGDMLSRTEVPIASEDTAQTLHDKLAGAGADLLVATLTRLEAGETTPQPQPAAGVTYAAKLTKQEAWIDWSRGAEEIARKVRALNPWPVACTRWGDKTLRLWRACAVAAAPGTPGTVIRADSAGILVSAGDGAVRLEELQAPGGKPLLAGAFLNGYRMHPGDRLESA